MDHIVRRLENWHRALRAAPEPSCADARIAETVAECLRDLHAISAQVAGSDPARRRLRLIDVAEPSAAGPS